MKKAQFGIFENSLFVSQNAPYELTHNYLTNSLRFLEVVETMAIYNLSYHRTREIEF